MQPPEQDRFKLLEKIIEKGRKTFVEVGLAIAEIKSRKLYRETHETFEAYCEERWDWTRQHVTKMLGAAVTISQLPAEDQKKIASMKAANALQRVPEKLREAVLDKATEDGEVATAKAIRAATPPPPKEDPEEKPKRSPTPPKLKVDQKKLENALFRDFTGFKIPVKVRDLYYREKDVTSLITYLVSVKLALEKAQQADPPDKLWVEVNFSSARAHIDQAIADLRVAIPFAVCPSCAGESLDNCGTCKGRGFVSKFFWSQCVPQEQKDLRSKIVAEQGIIIGDGKVQVV